MFKPVVMLRINRGDQNLDMLFCFSCNDVYSDIEGTRIDAEISEAGRRSFIRYFHQILPANKDLKQVYGSYLKIYED
jgi:hypothetical protein